MNVYVDITGVSLMVGFDNGILEVGQTANSAATVKEEKRRGAYKANQHGSLPFVMDKFVFLASESIELLNGGTKSNG